MLMVWCKSGCKNLGTYFSMKKRRIIYTYFLWKSKVRIAMYSVSVNTEILTLMSTIQSPLKQWLYCQRCHSQGNVLKCVPEISTKNIWVCHIKCSDFKYETIMAETASIQSRSQNLFSLVDIYIELHSFSKSPCLFLKMMFDGRT